MEAFSRDIARTQWSGMPARVVDNTRRLLDLLARANVRGTFFVLGWVAQRWPALVREIAAAGHELGCHSYWHRLIYSLNREEFAEDTRRAKAAIEDAAGVAIVGYRAPTFSITHKSLWALDVLSECGFRFDSSIYPIHHDNYGMPGTPRYPYSITCSNGARITEFPISSFRSFIGVLPVAGGGYLRMLPMWYNKLGLRSIAKENHPAMVYVHPWEIDAQQPKIKTRLKSRLRHYTNLRVMEAKLRHLLAMYRFAPISEVTEGMRLPGYQIDRASGTLCAVKSEAV